ncbi:hypothetical protein E4U40_001840 [Claviceps sp. LM458 group G5]|nr:hypothetical protein E4U40_001840 [Claviceps sp. LM458 group G5]
MRQDDKKSRFAKPRFRPSRGWRDLTSPKIAPGRQTAVGLRVRVGFTRQKQKRAGRTGAGDDPDQVSPKCKRPRGRVANCKRERWSEYGKVKSKGEVGAGGKLDVRDEMSVSHDSRLNSQATACSSRTGGWQTRGERPWRAKKGKAGNKGRGRGQVVASRVSGY